VKIPGLDEVRLKKARGDREGRVRCSGSAQRVDEFTAIVAERRSEQRSCYGSFSFVFAFGNCIRFCFWFLYMRKRVKIVPIQLNWKVSN
jgi:hypothetical protein